MTNRKKTAYILQTAIIFLALPLLMWFMGNVPTRTILKETISVGILLSFSLMLGLIFLTVRNPGAKRQFSMSTAFKLHKWIGYVVVAVILSHPFLIVVPRYFEAGVEPFDAFEEIITSFRNQGVLFGLVAWGFLLILGATSLLRKRLPMKHATWRTLHGVLAIAIIILGAWHAINLGHHVGRAMSIYLAVLAGGGVTLLIENYVKALTTTEGQAQ